MPIVAMPDGANVSFPDDMPPEQIKGLIASKFPEVVQSIPSVQTGQDMGRMTARVQGFNSAIPFGERIAAGLGSGLAYGYDQIAGEGDTSLGEFYKIGRENQAATEAANPGEYATGAGAGIVATLPMLSARVIGGGAAATTGIRGGVNAIPAAFGAVGNYVRGGKIAADAGQAAKLASLGGKALRGAAVAGTSGALYGYGASENALDTSGALEDARSGGRMGAYIGGALPVAGAVLGPQVAKLADYLTKKIATNSGEIISQKLPPELQKIYQRLRADFPDDDEFRQVINSYVSRPNQTLLEAGGARTQNLAEGSAMYPSGGAKATEFFDEAMGQAPERLKTAVSKTVSPSTNYYDTLDDMVKTGREKAAPIYQQAFARNQSVQSPKIDRILSTPEGRSALGEAAKNMQNEMSLLAKPDKELTAIARELDVVSQGGVASGLKLKTLDYIKKSMDDTINKAYRAGDEAEARRIVALKKGLVSEIDAADKSGLYAKARKASGDYLSNKEAMDNGLNFLKEDKEIIARKYKEMGASEKSSYKTGVVKAIRNQIENTTDGRNVATIFNKPATRDKLKSILGEKEYTKLNSEAQVVDNIFKLRNQMTGNSRTAMRKIAAEEFDNEGAAVINSLATKGATRTALDGTIKWIAKRFDGLSDKSAGEVANILYEQDPKKKYQIVKSLLNQAKSEGTGLRKTEAAKKLEVFYGLSDAISMKAQKAGASGSTK